MAAPMQHAMATGAVAPMQLHYWPGAAASRPTRGQHGMVDLPISHVDGCFLMLFLFYFVYCNLGENKTRPFWMVLCQAVSKQQYSP